MAFFRPQPFMTLFSILGVILLITLGNWQLKRLEWKLGLIEAVEARTELEAVPVEEALASFTLEEMEYRPVTAMGTYDYAREVHLFGRNVQGYVGYFIYTPLLRSGLPTILVNRGHVPERQMEPGLRQAGQIAGEVLVTGLARAGGLRGKMVPENEIATNEWYWRDLPGMAAHFGEVDVLPVFIDQELWDIPGGLPQGGQTRLSFVNDHLSYALTWYGLAIVLIGVYLAYHISVGRLAPQFFRKRSNTQ